MVHIFNKKYSLFSIAQFGPVAYHFRCLTRKSKEQDQQSLYFTIKKQKTKTDLQTNPSDTSFFAFCLIIY